MSAAVRPAPGDLRRRRLLLGAAAAWGGGVALGARAASGLPDLIAEARPSILAVGTYKATDSPRFGFRGTGFVVADARGEGTLVATNFHVLPAGADSEGGPQVAVVLAQRSGLGGRSGGDGLARMARVVATDRVRDLALLRIDGPPLPALKLAPGGSAREGQDIALMGFPIGGVLGYAVVTHRGIVASITTGALPAPTASQLDPRALARLRQGNFELLQLDATAYPGQSGSPVLDIDSGRVIAVVSMVLVKGSRESALSSPTGITYAVPVAYLEELLRGL